MTDSVDTYDNGVSEVTDVDKVANNEFYGVPGLSFLPLVNLKFSVYKEIKISVANEGNIHELSPDVFINETEDYKLISAESLDAASMFKVILAHSSYPKLMGNQIFAINNIVLEGDLCVISGVVLNIEGVVPLEPEMENNNAN